ncbi:MAG: type II secretion system F family protein [Micropruina sp.]|uniref:type II secretion system F family protein n=1 Tax=Micropruina sp. TaxID=2737536 RepID=UPI0039E654D7
MTAALAALLGALLVGGVVLVVLGFRPRTDQPALRRRSGTDARRRMLALLRAQGPRLAIGVVAGVGFAALTGMGVMVVVVPIAVVGLPMLLSAPPNRDIDLLESLDRWVRGLAATLPTGRSITDAIRVSVRNAPDLLAPPLALLVARLDERWTAQEALRAMADELDSPDADAVLASLALASERGGTGATATLNALADSIQDRLKAQREIETERAKPRIVVRQVTVITLVVLAVALLFGREFFAPYGTPLGQVILLSLLTLYVAALLVMRRMTLPRRRDRILRSLR